MNDNRIIITEYDGKTLMAVYEEEKYRSFSFIDETDIPVGSIINARVDSRLDNLDALFVCLDGKEMGYLEGSKDRVGSLIPVMIQKSALKNKRCVVTKELSIKGVTCIVSDGTGKSRCSKKLSESEKKRLLKLIESHHVSGKYDVVIRTNAAYVSDASITEEYERLCGKLDEIHYYSEKRTAYNVLYKQYGSICEQILKLNLSRSYKVITDKKDVFDTLKEELYDQMPGELKERFDLTYYTDELCSLNAMYSIKNNLEEALQKKVWLKSGGYLYIEETEALNVIDVNSGKIQKKGEKEDTVKRTNLEAVCEAARQIRLRNLSGIILIDLINMKNGSDREEIIQNLVTEIKKDPIQTDFHDVTKLGLIELTRKREQISLRESIGNKNK
ncbi:MAG: ribonuclease E/G [Lachnospiraceae bacterium]|nr:ribonuclease E/G [Lachnospiraceae bacterium]